MFKYYIFVSNEKTYCTWSNTYKMDRILRRFFIVCFYLYMYCLGDPIIKRGGVGVDSINRFNTASCLCQFQVRIRISNAICHGLFVFSCWGERWLFVLLILVELLIINYLHSLLMLTCLYWDSTWNTNNTTTVLY